ncbi:MAG: hypothetical protein CL609_15295 [Anaerolineaceae bacterium]|nr:hypothetical protein [Anaerolineaceae bacterium]
MNELIDLKALCQKNSFFIWDFENHVDKNRTWIIKNQSCLRTQNGKNDSSTKLNFRIKTR